MKLSERLKLLIVLGIAVMQGSLYLVLVPPWQHYDEPTHFEYAWLIAHGHLLPSDDDVDFWMRREVAASMLRYDFYRTLTPPDLMRSDRPIDIGYSELVHPPAYYLVVSLPLHLVQYLDVTIQLYVARLVSLVLFVLTLIVAASLMQDLTPPGHALRWMVPLVMALMPPFVDVMTAVNNDVGAVLVFSLYLRVAVRLIRFGVTWQRVSWLIALALLATFTKNTASIAWLLIPIVLMLAVSTRNRRPRLVLIASMFVLVGLLSVQWTSAAYWYNWQQRAGQYEVTRSKDKDAPLGSYVLTIAAEPDEPNPYLLTPVLAEGLQRITGTTVTVGGWIWANQSTTIEGPGLIVNPPNSLYFERITRPISVTISPKFVAWSIDVPPNTGMLHYAFVGRSITSPKMPLRVFLDGAFIIPGVFSPGTMPVFDDSTAHTGSWDHQRIENLVRNASAEQQWPRLHPALEQAVVRYLRRSPSQVLSALIDVERTGPYIIGTASISVLQGFFTHFGWGHVGLQGQGWNVLFYGLTWIAILGCIKWFLVSTSRKSRTLRAALGLMAVASLLLLGNTILRPLPLLLSNISLPVARYAFPSIIPVALALAAGWRAAWPRPYQMYGSLCFILAMIGINVVSIWTIWSFYYGHIAQ